MGERGRRRRSAPAGGPTFNLLLPSLRSYPHWHAEIRTDDNPVEAGMLFACKLKEGDAPFLGSRVLKDIKGRGVSKRKAFFTLDA